MSLTSNTENRTNIRLTRGWIRVHLRNGRIMRKRFKDAVDRGKRNYIWACTAFDRPLPHTIFRCNRERQWREITLDKTAIFLSFLALYSKECLMYYFSDFFFFRLFPALFLHDNISV